MDIDLTERTFAGIEDLLQFRFLRRREDIGVLGYGCSSILGRRWTHKDERKKK